MPHRISCIALPMRSQPLWLQIIPQPPHTVTHSNPMTRRVSCINVIWSHSIIANNPLHWTTSLLQTNTSKAASQKHPAPPLPPPPSVGTVYRDVHTCTMPEWQTSARKHRYNPLSTSTQRATAATETPLSLAITHPSIDSIPSSTLVAFKDDVRDNLHRYALLEKPIRSRDDMAHIKKVVADFVKVYFPIEASKCSAY